MSVQIHRAPAAAPSSANGPPDTAVSELLPPVLRTPAGLALLELQGTVNLPDGLVIGSDDDDDEDAEEEQQRQKPVPIGRIEFSHGTGAADTDTAWMRHVHLYVGAHQRLTGEIKKLPRPMAVVRRRQSERGGSDSAELEIVDIIHYKLLFSQRPEPMT